MSRWKNWLAQLVKRPFFNRLMQIGIQLIVPKQRIGVGLVVFNQFDQVLLLKHVFHPHSPWGVPGGWLERGESPAAGAQRELWEETGLTAVIGPPILTTYEKTPAHIGISYLGWLQNGTLTLSSEILEAQWVDIDYLPHDLFPFTRQAIVQGYQLHQQLGFQANCAEEKLGWHE